MQAKLASQIEDAATNVASTGLGLAGAWSAYILLLPMTTRVAATVLAFCVAGGVTLLTRLVLVRATSSNRGLASATFDLLSVPVEPAVEELLLTDVHEPAPQTEEILLLDDILAELGPDSRVVRLFDRITMPTPAQLKSRIDAHLSRAEVQVQAPDASQALHDALAELRRSMR